jgi:hypothetical protein
MVFDYGGQEVVNVFNVQTPAAPTSTDRTNIATAFHTWWTNNLKAYLVPDMKLTLIRVVDLSSQNSPSTEVSVSPPEAGTASGSDSVAGGALVVTHRTGLRGRNYRGRTYLAGWSESQRTDNVSVVLTYATNLVNAFVALVTALNSAGYALVVLSKFFNKAPRGQGAKTVITGFTMDTAIDSQRRRLKGRGA